MSDIALTPELRREIEERREEFDCGTEWDRIGGAEQIEATENEVVRLRKLFALVPHHHRCSVFGDPPGACSCVKSKVGPHALPV